MKPLPAVGLASSILQIVDFGVKITKKDRRIFQSIEDEHTPNLVVSQSIVDYLSTLLSQLEQDNLQKLTTQKRGLQLSEPAERLLKISDELKEPVDTLIDAVRRVQAQGSYSDLTWRTGRGALMSVLNKKEVKTLKKRFKHARKDADASLLLALRYDATSSLEQLINRTANIWTSQQTRACLSSARRRLASTTRKNGRNEPWMQSLPINGDRTKRKTLKHFTSTLML
jgi:hypothetical protein